MAFTEQEKQLIIWGKANGKTRQEVEQALVRLRSGAGPKEVEVTPASDNRSLVEKGVDALGFGGAVDVLGSHIARAVNPELKDAIEKPTTAQNIGAALQIGATLLPGVGAGASLPLQVAVGAGAGYLYDVGEGLIGGEGSKALVPGTGTGLGAAVPPALRGASRAVAPLLSAGKGLVTKVPGKITEVASRVLPENVPEIVSGAVQKGTEVLERVPRFVGRVREGAEVAAQRAERIKSSPPVVQKAIKSELDERVINTIQQADQPTLKAYKEIVDIAENPSKTLKPKQRPEIVAGNVAADQFGVIEKQRKAVGKRIGEAVDELSKEAVVPMQRSFDQLDDVLVSQGIVPEQTKKGVVLKFTGKFTPAERNRIQELYTLAKEAGDTMTPRQVYDMDQLFSKLQRETRMEGIGDILIEVGDQRVSLFRIFRDIFTNTLDQVSPEDIRALNRAYRNLVTLQDDIENSIIKSGKFETTKGVDPAEFAQTNLRRILSDAQSAADYRAILEEMDAVSRKLGFAGPRADDLIAFATEMRNIYPDTIPATGFAGGIRTGLVDLARDVLTLGKPDQKDKQKALRELIESSLNSQGK